LKEGDSVSLVTDCDDRRREVGGLRITPYDIPVGCVGGYYPELNPLIPLWHHAERAKVPAGKSVPVRVRKSGQVIDFGAVKKLREDIGSELSRVGRDLQHGGVETAALGARAIGRHPAWAAAVALLAGVAVGFGLSRRDRAT
jgi:hypothetical protein